MALSKEDAEERILRKKRFSQANADPSRHLLSADSIPILTVQVGVNTTFIHISDLFWRYILDLFLELIHKLVKL